MYETKLCTYLYANVGLMFLKNEARNLTSSIFRPVADLQDGIVMKSRWTVGDRWDTALADVISITVRGVGESAVKSGAFEPFGGWGRGNGGGRSGSGCRGGLISFVGGALGGGGRWVCGSGGWWGCRGGWWRRYRRSDGGGWTGSRTLDEMWPVAFENCGVKEQARGTGFMPSETVRADEVHRTIARVGVDRVVKGGTLLGKYIHVTFKNWENLKFSKIEGKVM